MSARFLLTRYVDRDRLLKRRIVWLIGQWVSAEEDCAQLPIIWQIMLHTMQEDGEATDIAVKLSAVVSIHQCVDVRGLPCRGD